MHNSVERSSSPVQLPHSEAPSLGQRHHTSPVYGSHRSGVHTTNVPKSPAATSHLNATPLWNRQPITSPTQTFFSDGFASVAPPLLLSRSIRETTLQRVEGGLSRTASNYVPSGDDTDDGHGAASPSEMPELSVREASCLGSSSGRGRGATTSTPRMTSPSSPAVGTSGEPAVMNFESLWSNIDRYLFAVYTTLQTGDESSLRPLRTPRHRMGWYTVIYNACSGDPAKSRELYTRLALLLLHLLESHVLFPILQNVDHSRIQFLTGTEEDGMRSASAAATRLSGSESVMQLPSHQQQQQQQPSQSATGGGWGRLRSIATGAGGGASFTGHARSARSKDSSRNSSFQGSVGGSLSHSHPPASTNTNNASNSSFGFMRRLFQSSQRATSPAVSADNDDMGDEGGIADLGRQPSTPGLRHTPGAAQHPFRGRVGWSSTSGPSTPLQLPNHTNSDVTSTFLQRGNGAAVAVGASSELHSAFEGFDSTVRRRSSDLEPPSTPPMSRRPTPTRPALAIQVSPTPTTPHNGPVSKLTSPGSAHGVPLAPSVLSRESTVRTVTHTTSGLPSSSASQSSTTAPRTAPATAPPSVIAAHHARVASKTGRVLVDDEEEVICEENTVASSLRKSKRNRRAPAKATAAVGGSGTSSNTSRALPLPSSPLVSTHTHTADTDYVDDGSLHTMNSSLSSRHSSNGEEGDTAALTGVSTAVFHHERRHTRCGPRRGRTVHAADATSVPGDETEDSTAVPSANFVSPSSSSLVSAPELGSALLSMSPSSATFTGDGSGAVDHLHDDATTAPPSTIKAAKGEKTHTLPHVLHGPRASEPEAAPPSEDRSTATTPVFTESASRQSPPPLLLSRQTTSSGPNSFYTGCETAVPMSPSTVAGVASSPHGSPLCDGSESGHGHGNGNSCTGETTASAADRTGSKVYGGRRFSLCYTFIQEWQTFLAFRGVVLSCFRYLDQYYTRRYGMDTITLMCFKVFYVSVYEPLRPLLVLELRYLTRYVREVFETTGQIAWEQLELIQATYNIMAELLVLVQSTSSYMVAQQQQQQQKPVTAGASSAGVTSITVTNTTSTAAVAAPAASRAPAEPPRSRTSSQGRGGAGGGGGGGQDSGASSVVSTPRMGSLEAHARASFPAPSASNERSSTASLPMSRRRRLLSLFSGKRHSDSATSAKKEELRPTQLRPVSPSDSSELVVALVGGRPAAASSRHRSPSRASPSVHSDGGGIGHTGLSVPDDALDLDSVDFGGDEAGLYAGVSPLKSPVLSTVVVDLRGTVELRDRLEGHTTAHHLTTQALKQWEGLAADRRMRNGTIVKETAKPLAAIVMEDLGNDYVAGIYSFYRCASKAHRDTDEGRRYYVEWAVGVKALEAHVWRRVRLPFLHTALRSALNEVLVVEQHRSVLLDRQFGLRALLDAWSASVKTDDLALSPQVVSGVGTSSTAGKTFSLRVRGDAGASTGLTTGLASASPRSGPLPGTTHALPKATSEFVEAPIQLGLLSADQHFASSFPHQLHTRSFSLDKLSRQNTSQVTQSTLWGEEEATTQPRESSWRWDRVSGASVVIQSATAAATAAGAALAALGRSGSEQLTERVGAWVGMSEPGSSPARLLGSHQDAAAIGSKVAKTSDSAADGEVPGVCVEAERPLSVSAASVGSLSAQQGPAPVAPVAATTTVVVSASTTAVNALQALYSIFSDVTEDECFVLMAAVLITAFIRDAADLMEAYVRKTCGAAAAVGADCKACPAASAAGPPSTEPALFSPSSPPPTGTPAAAAATASLGVELMTELVDLIGHYTELVETVFQGQPIIQRALSDAVEEIMCPTRWTKKGSQQAAQLRTQELIMAAAAAAGTTAATATSNEDGAAAAKSELPSVLLSRDARHATVPLVSLATRYPQAVQQLKLSVLLARYADAFLIHERVGGRIVSSDIYKRLHLIGRLVSLLEDKDTFLEHYRLCLARRLLGMSGSTTLAGPGRDAHPARSAPAAPSSATPNVEAERQLVGCLQSHLGATGTHAFEAMLRDYEGTLRTRELFEREAGFTALPAKIRVQLITSAQWPMYTMLPLTPHPSLQRGMDVFRGYYARTHPSRTLTWVFSLGTATLAAEVVSGTKQIVASTLLATLLLVVSDGYNARHGQAGSMTGSQIAQKVGMPFHVLRTHLHLLSHHRAFNLLRWMPAKSNATRAAAAGAVTAAAIIETDSFTLNPHYTHKLRKIRLPLPKTRLTGLPSSEVAADQALSLASEGAGGTAGAPPETEDAVVNRHVMASRRLLLDTALVRVFKSRRVALFEDLFQAVTTQLSRQFVPTHRDVKAQLEGLIDRDYVKRSEEDPNTFVYVS